MPAGYSGTPLAKKLSLKPCMAVVFEDMPAEVRAEIDATCPDLRAPEADEPPQAVHVFTTEAARLRARLARARDEIAQDGFVWVSWPKRASKVPTDITEDTIREIARPMGLVDVKVCAVDAVWSGLKLMIRKELRTG